MSSRHSVALSATTVRGAIELEVTEHGVTPHRLPRWALEQVGDDRLAMSETQPAGVRIAFRLSLIHI